MKDTGSKPIMEYEMSDLFSALKKLETNTQRKHFTLTEIVGVLALVNEGFSLEEIAKLTNRKVASLNYKFRENETLVKGVRTTRSVKKYKTMEDLYAGEEPGASYSEEDVERRIAEFKASVFGSNSSKT